MKKTKTTEEHQEVEQLKRGGRKADVTWTEYSAQTEFDYRVDNNTLLSYESTFGDSELDMKLHTEFTASQINFRVTAPDNSVQEISIPITMLADFTRRVIEMNNEISRLQRIEFTSERKAFIEELNHVFQIGLVAEYRTRNLRGLVNQKADGTANYVQIEDSIGVMIDKSSAEGLKELRYVSPDEPMSPVAEEPNHNISIAVDATEEEFEAFLDKIGRDRRYSPRDSGIDSVT